MKTPVQEFRDPSFQLKVLALIINNNEVLKRHRPMLRPEYWMHPDLQTISKHVLNYFDQYKTSPDKDSIRMRLESGERNDPTLGTWVEILDLIIAQTNLDYTYDQLDNFLSWRVYSIALDSAKAHLEECNFESIEEDLRVARQKLTGKGKAIDFFDDPLDRLLSAPSRETIPTGIDELDKCLGGGPAKQELTVILAPPGVGKTTMLINMGVAAMKAGNNVIHFFVEQTDQIIWERYASCMLTCDMNNLRTDAEATVAGIKAFQAENGASLSINYALGQTISNIRASLYRLEKPADLVIIDYADKLVSSRRYNDLRHEIATIYTEMVSIGKEFGVAVYTASQTNREGKGKKYIDVTNAAESWEKVAIADNIIALSQTQDEEIHSRIRLLILKARNEEGSTEPIPCVALRSCMTIISDAMMEQVGMN